MGLQLKLRYRTISIVKNDVMFLFGELTYHTMSYCPIQDYQFPTMFSVQNELFKLEVLVLDESNRSTSPRYWEVEVTENTLAKSSSHF